MESIAEGLRVSGYAVDTATDGETAEEMIYIENYDLVILDVNMPKMDGFSVLKTVREYNKELNIIMLTARSDIEDKVKGLDFGANDYMTKPFSFRELNARIRSLLRRKSVQEDSKIKIGDLKFDTVSRETFVKDEKLKLTTKETGILEYLILNRGRFVTQDEILEHVWEDEIDSLSNTVRVHMSALRKKLKNKLNKNIIINVIGEGYKIDEE